MKFSILGSGSKGNCTLVESGSTTLLIDAGFSGKEISRRLALINRTAEEINAILVTHEHGDHIGGAGVLSRRYNLPVYANCGTHQAAESRIKKLHKRMEFGTGQGFEVNGLAVHPFRISHDTADPVGFVVTDSHSSLAYCTDTGVVSKLIAHRVRNCNALILESNHDPQMLMDGPYPMPLKQRVKSNQGHLSNGDAARFLATLVNSSLRHVILAHLSETNNLPNLALERAQKEVLHLEPGFDITLACQDTPTALFSLEE